MIDYDEYDFEKLEKEYEAEMRELRDQLGGTSEDEDFDDEDSETEEDEEVFKKGIAAKANLSSHAPKREESSPEKVEDYEEEFIWPRRKTTRTVEKPKSVTLGDRFTDYLTMKTSQNRKLGGSLRSLQSSEAKSTSLENMKRMLDFDGDERCITPNSKQESQSPPPPPEEDPDATVQIHEVRRAIILLEEKQEAERIEREKRKELERLEAIEREAALEARRRANRKQKSEEEIVEEVAKVFIDPEKIPKIIMLSILLFLIPIYWYYDVWVMLLVFVLCLLIRNKCR